MPGVAGESKTMNDVHNIRSHYCNKIWRSYATGVWTVLISNFRHVLYVVCFLLGNSPSIGFGGLEVVCWLLVPKFTGSNPADAVGFLRAKKILSKILSTPSFGGEVKPSIPCHRLAARKRSLELRGS
jgi:hypothetical protein